VADDERSGEARAIAERALGRLAVVTGGATVGRRGAPSRLPKNPPVCRAWSFARPRCARTRFAALRALLVGVGET
jgi:hypothetical protein